VKNVVKQLGQDADNMLKKHFLAFLKIKDVNAAHAPAPTAPANSLTI